MKNIVEPNETFDFSQLSLAHPTGIQGGAYFTKIEFNKNPLYIQTTKSQTKQGFVKTGKKYYCDLMFDKNSETLIHWFEKLEEKCQKLIFDRRDTWFQNSLEESDIETAFNSTIRVYKSGKYYLVRTNINNLTAVKIYNEIEAPLTISDIMPETNIVSILEVQGIKFTSRNFQIELELKQIMVLDNAPIFDNCLIKTKKDTDIVEYLNIKDVAEEEVVVEEVVEDVAVEDVKEDVAKEVAIEEPYIEKEEVEDVTLVFEDLDLEDDIEELKEVTNLEISLETIQLKKPNQVYFELYKEARNKAKIAKKNALLAYLEAKNIKKTYMIEPHDSDSDIDIEIDDVSESELEGL
jgi:hypothetical protein